MGVACEESGGTDGYQVDYEHAPYGVQHPEGMSC